MYRLVIEHPQWIPEDWQRRLDLRAGHDRGRIYRVVSYSPRPQGGEGDGVRGRPIPRLDKLDTAGLVAALDSDSGWQRDLAQQMLIWKGDKTAAALRDMTRAKKPLARLHALCTLDGLRLLREDDVLQALGDPHPGLRRHGVRLSEPFLSSPRVRDAVLTLVSDSDAQVQMQLAYTLGEIKDAAAGTALARLAMKNANDPHLLSAVYSSLNRDNVAAVLTTTPKAGQDPPAHVLEQMVRFAVALRDDAVIDDILSVVVADSTPVVPRLAAVSGILAALKNRPASAKVMQHASVQRALDQARLLAADTKAAQAERLAALRLLAHRTGDDEKAAALLAGLLGPRSTPEIQQAALTALSERGAPSTPRQLLAAWTILTPRLRAQALDALLGRQQWTSELLDRLEKDPAFASHVDALGRQRLLQHKTPEIRSRAGKLLTAGSGDRRKVVHEFKGVLDLQGDAVRGREIFRQRCAACHKLEGVGQQVGPDLTALSNRTPQFLLEAMLDPNAALEDRFVSYLAATTDGRFFTGLLASETSTSITVITQDGKEQSLLRSELDELQSTGKSLMPEGLEKDMAPQQFADVIAYTLHCAAMSAQTSPPR
jgi:putative heme-binding domain-containing protein